MWAESPHLLHLSLFCEPIWDQSFSCIELEACVHCSAGVLASAWLVVFSCFWHWVILCADNALGWSKPIGVSSLLFYMSGCGLWAFHLLGKLAHSACGKLSRSTLSSFIVLETKSSSFRKNQKISLWSVLDVSGRYFARFIWTCTVLYHSSTLLVPCLKLSKDQSETLLHSLGACKTLQNVPRLYPS